MRLLLLMLVAILALRCSKSTDRPEGTFALDTLLAFTNSKELIDAFGSDHVKITHDSTDYVQALLYPGTKQEVEIIWSKQLRTVCIRAKDEHLPDAPSVKHWITNDSLFIGMSPAQLHEMYPNYTSLDHKTDEPDFLYTGMLSGKPGSHQTEMLFTSTYMPPPDPDRSVPVEIADERLKNAKASLASIKIIRFIYPDSAQSVAKQRDIDPYRSFSIDAGRDTAALHAAFVQAFEAVDTSMTVSVHDLRPATIFAIGTNEKGPSCVSGYLISIYEFQRNAEGDFPDSKGLTYFVPEGDGHYGPGDYGYVDTDLEPGYQISASKKFVLDYQAMVGCPLLGVEREESSAEGGRSAIEFFVWSTDNHSLKSVAQFQTSIYSRLETGMHNDDEMSGVITFLKGSAQVNSLEYKITKGENENIELYVWDGAKFGKR